MDFNLPAISSEAHPEFADAKSCEEWLHNVPLINVSPAHSRLLGQLEELNCCDIAPAERLRILEALIEPVAFVQAEQAKKFAYRALLLAKQERDILHQVMALWDALAHGYQRGIMAFAAGAPGLGGQEPLLYQRALWCAAQRLREHYRSFHDFEAEEWGMLHRLYALAEDRRVLQVPVSDPVNKEQKITCHETYCRALLLHLANDPSENGPKQLAVIAGWTERWAQKVAIGAKPPEGSSGVAPLSVDLASGSGPSHATPAAQSVRYLNVAEISKGISSRVALLRKGDTPEALGLGEGITAAAAEQLLLAVHRHWCEPPKARVSSRKGVTMGAEVGIGVSGLHFYISGRPFRQPVESKDLSKSQHEEIATFGRLATRQDDEYSQTQGQALESWSIRDESLGGMRIERAESAGKARYLQQQLLGVRPQDAKSFMLCTIRWLSVSANFDLRAGLRVLPGVPQPVAIRATGLNTATEKFVQALLLPAVPALQSPATLIVPPGWYRPKRVIEVFSTGSEQILLTGVVDRGSDFERLSFGAP